MNEEDLRIHAEFADAVIAAGDLEDIASELGAFLVRLGINYRTVKRNAGIHVANRELRRALSELRSGRHGAWLARAVEHRVRELGSCKP